MLQFSSGEPCSPIVSCANTMRIKLCNIFLLVLVLQPKQMANEVRRYKLCTAFITSKHMCLNNPIHQGERPMNSRLKYSRNALCINALPIARYFRQRFAPFIRHRRRSQGYPYKMVQTIAMLRSGIICCELYKLSSRTKIVGFVHNNG